MTSRWDRAIPSTRALWIASFCLFTVACTGLWGAAVWHDRQRTVDDAKSEASLTARLLEVHAERALDSGASLLDRVANDAAGWDLGNAAEVRPLAMRIVEAVKSTSLISGLWILDAEGNLVLSSQGWPARSENYRQRRYFLAHRNGEAEFFVGPSGPGAITGQNRFTLSRTLRDSAGAFLGVVAVSVPVEFFEQSYDEVRMPEGSRVRLYADDGFLLTSWPPQGSGRTPPPLPAAFLSSDLQSDTVRDGDRLHAFQRLHDLPIVLATTLSLDAPMKNWARRTFLTAIAPTAAVIGFAMLMTFGLRGARQLTTANRELEQRVAERTADLATSAMLARSNEREARLVADSLPAFVAFVDADERYRFANLAYSAWVGRVRSDLEGRSLKEVLPAPVYRLVAPNAKRVLEGTPRHVELTGITVNGREYDVEAEYIPRQEEDGRIIGFYVFASDVTERKRTEKRQSLMMAELDHRVRNILATIESMISLTARSTDDKDVFRDVLKGRIAAMARTHSILTQRRWRGAEIAGIVRVQLAAYATRPGAYAVDIPADFMLSPKNALDLSLAIHELATNAAKYGALSRSRGSVHVTGTFRSHDGRPLVELVWREAGGPPIEDVNSCGFGTRLIRSVFGSEPDAHVTLDFAPEGVRCIIVLPLLDEHERHDDTAGQDQDAASFGGGQTGDLFGLRVLVVEDESLVAMDLERQLDELGATVVGPAHSVTAALSLVEEADFDVALLDLNLHGHSSEPIADRLIARGIQFMFLSGYDIRQVLPERLQSVPHMQKPVDTNGLAHGLGALQRKRAPRMVTLDPT